MTNKKMLHKPLLLGIFSIFLMSMALNYMTTASGFYTYTIAGDSFSVVEQHPTKCQSEQCVSYSKESSSHSLYIHIEAVTSFLSSLNGASEARLILAASFAVGRTGDYWLASNWYWKGFIDDDVSDTYLKIMANFSTEDWSSVTFRRTYNGDRSWNFNVYVPLEDGGDNKITLQAGVTYTLYLTIIAHAGKYDSLLGVDQVDFNDNNGYMRLFNFELTYDGA